MATLELLAHAVLITAMVFYTMRYINEKRSEHTKYLDKNDPTFDELRKQQRYFNEKVTLLETHGQKYFNYLHSAGLGELLGIRNAVNIAMEDVWELGSKGEKSKAQELMKFLRSPMSKAYPGLRSITRAEVTYLEDWHSRGNELILSCVIRLGIVTSSGKPADAEDMRRATFHSLDELKRVLSSGRH